MFPPFCLNILFPFQMVIEVFCHDLLQDLINIHRILKLAMDFISFFLSKSNISLQMGILFRRGLIFWQLHCRAALIVMIFSIAILYSPREIVWLTVEYIPILLRRQQLGLLHIHNCQAPYIFAKITNYIQSYQALIATKLQK